MSDKVAELTSILTQDEESAWIAYMWDKHHQQMREKIEEWKELRDYVFATDTTTTSNSGLPWKNSTTLPKLCQIRDNLTVNYMAALFPNDNWLVWQGYSLEDSKKIKRAMIQAYMSNKTREGGFMSEVEKLVNDYIDYGNAFATVSFENRKKVLEDGEVIPGYVGPKAQRISPLDIVFNPTASEFEGTYKIVRSIKTRGELYKLAATEPENAFWSKALERREQIVNKMGGFSVEDFDKAVGYQMDGFGNMYEYYQSDFFEILEFYGDYYNQSTGQLHTDRVMTIVDRSVLVRDEQIPSWLGHTPIYHVGWRKRPDNLWAMGPLDNLVGMQYRIDHLENLKADAMDLVVHPPLKIYGDVEPFEWAPGEEIHIDEGGDVQEASKNLNNMLSAESQIAVLEDRMELYAGAPREAMGIRTPGEKTAFEVQTLQNAAGRVFQHKVSQFEIQLLEPLLNAMLEISRRNMDGSDVIRVLDRDLGAEQFLTITKSDITASGQLRPVGARHFAKRAQDMQNLVGVFNSPIGQMVAPHTSGKALTEFVNDISGLKAYEIFKPNVAVFEQAETQQVMSGVQAQAEQQAAVPPPEEV